MHHYRERERNKKLSKASDDECLNLLCQGVPPHLGKAIRLKLRCILGNGAQGRDRTTDTAIFSRMLYQLSYLGAPFRLAAGL